MLTSRITLLGLIVGGIASLNLLGPSSESRSSPTLRDVGSPVLEGVAPRSGPTTVCELTALGARESARLAAHAEFWLRLSRSINTPSIDIGQEIQEAIAERQEALDLADEQFDARLDACEDLGTGPYSPAIIPSEFSTNITNPYFPLVPGRRLIYQKSTPRGVERLEVIVLTETVVIDGVTCRSVRGIETLNGDVREDTMDWFAQHQNGDVWYFGEVAQNFRNGFLDNLKGSWRSGRNGAKAGIIMLGAPAPETAYRQEFHVGVAEDIAEVISINQSVVVPTGTYTSCVQTEDETPLEPDNLGEFKFYAPGVGLVLELDIESGERLELIQIL